jgi:signal transduction histidine kinase/DNA-binding response OmpR family regulator
VNLLTLAVELAFAALFVATLATWLRRRDPLSRDVMLIFAAVAGLFVVSGIGALGGSLPDPVLGAALAFLLAQPLLTLRLAARVARVAPLVGMAVRVAWAATALPLIVLPIRDVPFVFLAGSAVFVVTNLAAATYLGVEARRRVGSARARLAAAAAASALMALALGAAALLPAVGDAGDAGSDISRILALLAALLYAAAFVPPAWARRLGGAVTTFEFTQHLLDGSFGEATDETWSRLADLGRRATGAVVAIVAVGDPPTVVASTADDRAELQPARASLAAVPSPVDEYRPLPDGGALASIARAVRAPYASVLSFDSAGEPAALVILRERPSLFAADDHAILTALIGRARIFAERSAAMRQEAALTQRLTATVSALERASQAKSDFLASMSHELRTPLNAIIGFAALMREEPLEDGRRSVPDEWITHVRRSGDHLLALINDVLDLTKIEAGRIELAPEPFDLGVALAESVEGLRPLADRKGIEVVLDAEPGMIAADRGRLRQIVYNLLSNAIKFTPERGRVDVEARWSGSDACISVADTGIGIAAEDLDHIFEEFSQVGDLKAREAGTGLGLALTRRLVEAHGGRITVSSAPGVGTRFEVRLPESLAALSPAITPPEPARRAVAGANVLVIEDDPGAVRLLRTYLEGEGYAVEVAPDGEAGIAAAHARPPDAIVLDVLLPGVDGWEVLRRLKSDAALRDIPVMVVTVIDERNVAMSLGAADYFLKPVRRDALLARLATYTFTTKVRQRSVRVLVIDDDPAARELVERALRPEGFEVLSAASGHEGLALAADASPDLVICDLVMPGMDGFEVVRRLAESDLPNDVPILILTGQELSAADRERLNGKVADIMEKGTDLRIALGHWLRRASSAAQRRSRFPHAAAEPAAVGSAGPSVPGA